MSNISTMLTVVFWLAWFAGRVYIACLHSGAKEETDHKHTALVCDSKSMVELAAYLWPTCGWVWDIEYRRKLSYDNIMISSMRMSCDGIEKYPIRRLGLGCA